MNWPAYPEYKNSGAAWLADIPASWKVDRLKFAFNRVQRPFSAESETVTAFRDGEVTLRSNRRTDGFTEADKYIGYQGIEPGDLAIHAMDGFAGAIGVSDSSGKCSPVVSVCSARPGFNPHYYGYILRYIALGGYLTAIAKGIRERSTDFRWADARDLVVPFPSAIEQDTVVEFLDRETGKIDALIDKQNQLIATLREDRTAIITHAVTKGLNPNAEMKDSGTHWIGQVPGHWSVTAAKNVAQVLVPDRDKPELHPAGDIPWITMDNIGARNASNISQFIRLDSRGFPPNRTVPAGTVVASCIGRFGVTSVLTSQSVINQQLQGYLPSSKVIAEFLWYYIQQSQPYFESISTSTTLPYVNQFGFGMLSVALPPKSEQIDVVSHLDKETAKINSLIGAATGMTEALREYRLALITAAVTGKIDVREAV